MFLPLPHPQEHIRIYEEEISQTINHTKELAHLEAKLNWIKCVDKNLNSNSYKQINRMISTRVNAINKLKTTLQHFLSEDTFTKLEVNLERIFDRTLNQHEVEIELQHRPPHVLFDQTAVFNHTNISVPQDILMAISWGKKFIFPYDPSSKNIHYFLAELEYTLDNAIPIAAKNFVARELKQEIQKMMAYQHDPKIQWLNFLKYRVLKFLDKNQNTKIIDSDKGACTMIIDIDDYNFKVTQFIKNTESIIPLEHNPTQKAIATEQHYINILRNNAKTAHLIHTYEPNTITTAKFYGTLKHHKENCPLRPIIATIGAPGYTLGKAFNAILTCIFPPTPRHIQCINTFKKDVDTVIVGPNDRLISFDAIAMYTNISPETVIQIVHSKIYKFKEIFDLNSALVLKILAFLLKEVNFFETKEGDLYFMESGLPMGGVISALASRLVIDDILDHTFQITGTPLYHKVYVDDSIFVIHKDNIENTLNTMNKHTKTMKFTIEYEQENSINFLNMTLTRQNEKIVTNWYKKPYASNRITNFYSAHKRSTILNTAIQHITTIIELSDGQFFHENKEKAINTLRNNNFPETLIISLINQHYTLMRPLHKYIDNKQTNTYISYPHTTNNTKLKRIIREFAHPNTTLAESIKNTKTTFTKRLKKPIQYEERGNVIATSSCTCEQKTKILTTKHNENGHMLKNRLITNNTTCNHTHAFNKVKLQKGMCYRGQSTHLARQLNWKHRNNLIDMVDFPNKHFRDLQPKSK